MAALPHDDLKRLRKLARRAVALTQQSDGTIVIVGGMGGPADNTDKTTTYDAEWLSRALARGWLELTCEDTWVLSRRGRAWLKAGAALSEEKTTRPAGRLPRASALDGRTTLGWLRSRKGPSGAPLISEAELKAGERLRTDYLRAQAVPHMTTNLSETGYIQGSDLRGQNGLAERMDRLIRARQRVEAALGAVGPDMAGVLIDICCRDLAMAAIEKAHGWPQRAGKVVVSLALRQLARHYGYTNERPPSVMLTSMCNPKTDVINSGSEAAPRRP